MNQFEGDSVQILVVDDVKDNVRFLVESLSAEGYMIRPALTGELALAAVQKSPPDLILLDIMMPGMDGFEVCRALKSDVRTHDIPVIFISAMDDMENKKKGFAMGGVDYIAKPFQVEEVLIRIKTHLGLRQAQRFQGVLELAGTVCHEFNQPLQILMGKMEMLMMKMDPSHPLHHDMALMDAQVKRMGKLTEKLMKISKYRTRSYLSSRIVDLDQSAG